MTSDGLCPRCGRPVDPGWARRATDPAPSSGPAADPVPESQPGSPEVVLTGGAPGEDPDGALPPVPWHLKLLVGAVALYLGWRAVQGVDWVLGRF